LGPDRPDTIETTFHSTLHYLDSDNIPCVEISVHSVTLSRFREDLSLLLNAAYLAEK